jgi:hypothetical protein
MIAAFCLDNRQWLDCSRETTALSRPPSMHPGDGGNLEAFGNAVQVLHFIAEFAACSVGLLDHRRILLGHLIHPEARRALMSDSAAEGARGSSC